MYPDVYYENYYSENSSVFGDLEFGQFEMETIPTYLKRDGEHRSGWVGF